MDATLTELSAFLLSNLTLILRSLVILLLAWLGMLLSKSIERRIDQRIVDQRPNAAQRARLKTLLNAGMGMLKVVIAGAAILMILMVFEINIVPILASAGVAGLAISLGAQTLIKDFIAGALILFENSFQVGDVIEVSGIVGTVERIELRTILVRDYTGKLITIPNGEIRILSNTSRDWSRAVVDIHLSLESDVNKAVSILKEAVDRAAGGEPLKGMLMESAQIQGWNKLSDWAVEVRITAKTWPGKHIEAAIAIRKAALEALQEAEIQLAVPSLRAGASIGNE